MLPAHKAISARACGGTHGDLPVGSNDQHRWASTQGGLCFMSGLDEKLQDIYAEVLQRNAGETEFRRPSMRFWTALDR